jgi:hypothetical protein
LPLRQEGQGGHAFNRGDLPTGPRDSRQARGACLTRGCGSDRTDAGRDTTYMPHFGKSSWAPLAGKCALATALLLAVAFLYPAITASAGEKNGSGGTCCRVTQSPAIPASSYLANKPGRASSSAQLTIENPSHLPVPEQKASLLLSTACRVIAEQFRISRPVDRQFSLMLVLGSKDEHYTADEDKGAYTLFLERWDERKFTVAVTNLAIQRLVIHDRLASIVAEILRRSAQVAPVPVMQLRGRNGPVQPVAGDTSGCMSTISEAAARNITCGPLTDDTRVRH